MHALISLIAIHVQYSFVIYMYAPSKSNHNVHSFNVKQFQVTRPEEGQ